MAPKDKTSSLRQVLHAATGDRKKEAEALADRSPDDVEAAEAETAVRRAHGDIDQDPSRDPRLRAVESHLAKPEDAENVHEEHQ
ncbi:MAG TPA: hypothetical protein VH914_20405 [Acidimicrobiia bacterium]|jgi:hypothetical protein|nr:hypothetical protein [Acidimicrobiia bacterium]